MFIPQWITFMIAGLVTVFGLYRIYLGWTSDEEALIARKSLYRMPPRRHMLYGIVYVIMGGLLIASGLGFNPFG